jgi:hypothetical protein
MTRNGTFIPSIGHQIMRSRSISPNAALRVILWHILPLPHYLMVVLTLHYQWDAFKPEIEFAQCLFDAHESGDLVTAHNIYLRQAHQSSGFWQVFPRRIIPTHRMLNLHSKYQTPAVA